MSSLTYRVVSISMWDGLDSSVYFCDLDKTVTVVAITKCLKRSSTLDILIDFEVLIQHSFIGDFRNLSKLIPELILKLLISSTSWF